MVEKENKYENKSRQKKKKTSKLMPILFITPLALTIIIASVFFVYYEQSKNVDDNEIVAKVNGLEITAAELSSKMAIDEEYVVNKFGKDYEEELNEDFWDLEVKDDDGNSTNPREYLQNMALKKLTAYKVEQQIAIENGIISESDAAYDAFLKNLKKANEGKSKKEKYSKKTYYEYVYKQLQKKNRVALSKKGKPLYASGSVLKEWFEKSNDEKYKKIDNFHFDIYYVYYDDKSNNYNKDAAVSVMKNAESAIKDGKSLSFVKSNISSSVFIQTMDINDSNSNEKQKDYPKFYKEAVTMKVGEFSNVYTVIRPRINKKVAFFSICRNRTDGGYKDFRKAKNEIFENYTAEKYKEYIENAVKKAKVEKFEKFSKVTGLD